MVTVRAPNHSHNGISAGVRFTAGVGETNNPAALAYFRRAGYEVLYPPEPGRRAHLEPIPIEKPVERMNKAELQAIAAELDLDVEGTNRELVARIAAKRAEG